MDKNLIRSEDRANIVVVGVVAVVVHVTIGHIHDVVAAAAAAGRRPIVTICQLRPTICRKQRVDS